MTRTATVDRADRVAELHDQLTASVEALLTSEDWKAMLDMAAKFHNYSARNIMLILCQRPDATRVAGFRSWLALGRHVRKGENGIAILAPCVYKRDDEVTGETVTRLGGFKVAHVFDIAQTDGDDIADVRPELLDGSAPEGMWDALEGQVTAAGYVVYRYRPPAGANGFTDPAGHRVVVRDDVDEAQAVKTLTHELAHILLDHVTDLTGYAICRGRCEVEAESVAHVVCSALGMPTDSYSLPYVARWADGNAIRSERRPSESSAPHGPSWPPSGPPSRPRRWRHDQRPLRRDVLRLLLRTVHASAIQSGHVLEAMPGPDVNLGPLAP